MNRFCCVFALLAVGLFVGPVECTAQQLSISGTVDDTYGVVPGVSVTLRVPAVATQKTTTDAQGRYLFSNLRPGSYEISVALEGFTTATRILSLTTQSRTVDLTLTVAGIATSVDVVDVAGQSTGSRMEIPDREIPSQVSVVSQTTLREQGVNDLASALENVSGVITQVQYGVYEWYTISGITQQSGNDFLHVDGMALTGEPLSRPTKRRGGVSFGHGRWVPTPSACRGPSRRFGVCRLRGQLRGSLSRQARLTPHLRRQ